MPQPTTPHILSLSLRSVLLCLVLFALGGGCTELVTPASNTQTIPHLKLTCELAPGWEADPNVTSIDPAKGGLLMRLQPRDRIAGSPRLEVRLDPLRVKPVDLKAFVQETVSTLKKVEKTGGAKTVDIQETQTELMGQPAVRVDHQYTIGKDLAQLSVSQSTWFTMIDGRATMFSVSGRTELTTPHINAIESVLKSLARLPATEG